jgi:hypothetical protein
MFWFLLKLFAYSSINNLELQGLDKENTRIQDEIENIKKNNGDIR